jgi:REP element-mobilizing transposase RayT
MPTGRIRSRGHLPHWEENAAVYFVTFRLADSLPRALLITLERSYASDSEGKIKRSRGLERFLERGYGACYLRKPAIAKIVAETFTKFDGQRYRLFAWCIMPNHVHVVFQLLFSFKLEELLHSWKSYTAQKPTRFWIGAARNFGRENTLTT